MSDIKVEENFWAALERDGSFKLGEVMDLVMVGRRTGELKTTFAYECLLEAAKENNLPIIYYDLERDYNGLQHKLNFDENLTSEDD